MPRRCAGRTRRDEMPGNRRHRPRWLVSLPMTLSPRTMRFPETYQRALRRVEVEADDVAHLLDEQRVGGQLEGLAAVRLQRERPPNAMPVEVNTPVALA